MRVLVVEDDLSFARLIGSAFRNAGLEVDHETSAETAIFALANTRYDAAIVDVILPGSSGIYVVDAVRRLPSDQRPDVVIVTGADPSALKTLDRAVVKAVLFKPVNIGGLIALVKGLRGGA